MNSKRKVTKSGRGPTKTIRTYHEDYKVFDKIRKGLPGHRFPDAVKKVVDSYEENKK